MVAIAKQYWATTISFTKIGSELSNLTDISIEIDIPEDQDIYKPSASSLVFTAIIGVLATVSARKRANRLTGNLRRIRISLLPFSKDVGPKPIGD